MATDGPFNPGELADLVAEVVGEATSDGGLVTVTVDAAGRVANVWLDPKVTQASAAQLAEAITTVCADAFDNRIDRLDDVVDRYHRSRDLPPEVLGYLRASVNSLRKTRPATTETTRHDEHLPRDDEPYRFPSVRERG